MALALRLAERGRYTSRPNPRVGCVLVKDGRLLAEGWHYRAGEAHAEVHALSRASQAPEGATAYVTLEPCCHRGKTGPCTQALIKAGIGCVVYAMEDPNPQVAGKGLAELAKAGIRLRGPLMDQQAAAINAGFIQRMQQQRPYVRCKLALSVDGRTAMADGSSQWLTGAPARADVQRLRARSCAIVTGIGSILQDNSRLSLRTAELAIDNADDALACPPLRVVLDSQLRIPDNAAVLEGAAKTLIVTGAAALKRQQSLAHSLSARPNVTLISITTDDTGRIVLQDLLTRLAVDYQCNEILLEAGATLTGAFLKQGLIDQWLIYQAPLILGASAKPMLDWSIDTMADKYQLALNDVRAVGNDLRMTFTPSTQLGQCCEKDN
ncbi:MAG: bifunctional diaminohydroxyphosphoribosylaminopyrimidine deaminase/5-amino-6-(5-phosphoribosylamino)uracil reductase RibD [Cellvibrionaceae bacterium]|nr:bifunctional diaminohydroxyphosphoribosylaminopyrimidine deaminase/5-amino-6-(5-phosphoribosylamino)uracil reductase RibD [Cellvibrionaceae bacterium]